MAKEITEVIVPRSSVHFGRADRILILGSCFASEIGARLSAEGFDVCINPFGTLFNPASIAGALELLCSDSEFGPQDCVQMGAGSQKICSWRHYTKFARDTQEEFLQNANERLAQARDFFKSATHVFITLGTAFVWEHKDAGIVANCLKRDAKEFTHRMMNVGECTAYLQRMVEICRAGSGLSSVVSGPQILPKQMIFTVSPIRHMSLGAHSNTLSKATLHLSVENILHPAISSCLAYFPAFEILTDQLRDYTHYASDLVHPSQSAADLVYAKFMAAHFRD